MKKMLGVKLFLCLSFLTIISCRSSSPTDDPTNCQNATDPGCHAVLQELTAPSSVAAIASSETKIVVSWRSPRYKDSFSIVVEKKKHVDTDYVVVDTVDSSDSSIDVTGLIASTAYDFRLQSVAGSKKSEYSSVVTGTTQGITSNCRVATSVVAAAQSSNQVNLTWAWNNTQNPLTYYNIQRSYSPSTTTSWTNIHTVTSAPATSYSDTSAPGGALVYRIVSICNSANFPSAESNVANTTSALAPVYRWYKSSIMKHFFSLSSTEGTSFGFVSEGAPFHVFVSSVPNSHLIYRCYNSTYGIHAISTLSNCGGSTNVNEGAYGYVYSSQINGAVPLYSGLRLNGSTPLDTLATTNYAELTNNYYTNGITILGYVVP